MKTTIKILKYVIIVLIIILLGVIIYNVAIKGNINPSSKKQSEIIENSKKNKEYLELLKKTYGEEEVEFVYVKENKTTITFKKQKESDKSLVANYIIDKKTKSITEEKQKGVPNSGE